MTNMNNSEKGKAFLRQRNQVGQQVHPATLQKWEKKIDAAAIEHYCSPYGKPNPQTGAFKDGAGWLLQQLQAAQPPAAIKLLKDYEQWEADLIADNEMWWPYVSKDRISGKTYDKMLELQERRNEILRQQKEGGNQ